MNAIHEKVSEYRDESWKLDHDRAMECGALEDWLDYGLSLLQTLRSIDDRYRGQLKRGEAKLDRGRVEAISRAMEDWYAPCSHLLGLIEQFEREGYAVANAAAFRRECAGSHLPGFEASRILRAAEQFAEGRGRRLEDVLGELRH